VGALFCAAGGLLPCPSGCRASGERVAASMPAKLPPRGTLRSSRSSVQQALTSIATKKRPLLRSLFSLNNSSSAHRRVSRFPATVRGRQSGHFLETGSLYLPLAALRLFPPSAKIHTIYPRKRPFPGIFFV